MFPHQQVHSPHPTPLMADPLGEDRQGAGSCKERKIGVMWKDVTKDEEPTMRGRTPAPRPGPSPLLAESSFLCFLGTSQVTNLSPSLEGSSSPPGFFLDLHQHSHGHLSSLWAPCPPTPAPARNGLCPLGACSAEAPKPASPAQPPLGSWSESFSAFGAKPCHSCLCKGSGASSISMTIGQMCAHLLTP